MPTGKRASMREGPLAALFRKTTEDQPADSPAADAPPSTGTERAPDTPTPGPAASAPSSFEEPHVPSPQERLRQAFSSDIPESLLERPQSPRLRPHGDPLTPAERYTE